MQLRVSESKIDSTDASSYSEYEDENVVYFSGFCNLSFEGDFVENDWKDESESN